MPGRKRTWPPSHKITIYIPVTLMEAFNRYVYEKKKTVTETIEALLRELLIEEGYLKEEQKNANNNN